MKLASRLDHIEPFYVMECAKAAVEPASAISNVPKTTFFMTVLSRG
jgi:hypothetical protein